MRARPASGAGRRAPPCRRATRWWAGWGRRARARSRSWLQHLDRGANGSGETAWVEVRGRAQQQEHAVAARPLREGRGVVGADATADDRDRREDTGPERRA